jgi:hypothetical protein
MKAKQTKELKTREQFLEFFRQIPEDNWTSVVLERDDGACCALGHLGIICAEDVQEYVGIDKIAELNVKRLAKIFDSRKTLPALDTACRIIYRINDAACSDPKDNIISALQKQ